MLTGNGETLTERMRPFGQKNVKDAAHWKDVAGGRGARSAIFVIVETLEPFDEDSPLMKAIQF